MTEVLRIEVVGTGAGAEAAVRRTRESVDRDAGAMESRGRKLAESTSTSTRRSAESWSMLGRSAKAGAGQAVAASREAEGAMAGQTRAVRGATAAHEEHRKSWVKTAATFAAGGVAIAGAYKAFGFAKSAVEDTGALAGATMKLSSITGLDTKVSSQWVEMMKLRGIQSRAVNMGFLTLSKSIEAAANGGTKQVKMLNDLGVSQEQIKKHDISGIINTVADSFQKMDDPQKRAAYGSALFGRQAQVLIPILSRGSDALRVQLNTFAGLTKQQERTALTYLASHRKMQAATEGLKIALGTALMPTLIRTEDRWTSLITKMNNPKLTATQKVDLFSKEVGHDIDRVGVVVEKAAPKIADGFAKAAPHAAMAFVNAFTGASTWGQILTGAFLLKKLGLLGGVFRTAGVGLGVPMGEGVAAGAAGTASAGRWSLVGRTMGGVFAGAFVAYAATQIASKLAGELLKSEVGLLSGPTDAKVAELKDKPLQRARRRAHETPLGEPRSPRVRHEEAVHDAAWRRIDRTLGQPTGVGDTATSRFSRAIAAAGKGNDAAQLQRLARLVPDALRHGASMSKTEARALEGVIASSLRRINANQPRIAANFKRDLQLTTNAVRAGIIPQQQAFVNLTRDIDRTLSKLPPTSLRYGKQAADHMIEQAKRQGTITSDEAKKMHQHVAEEFSRLAAQATSSSKRTADRVGGDFNRMKGVTFDAMGKMSVQFNNWLSVLGGAPKGTKLTIVGGPTANVGKQRGGWFGHPSERGPDDRLIAVAGGEAILTGHHQRDVNDALAFSYARGRARAPHLGGLFQSDTREHRTAYATGGTVVQGRVSTFGPPGEAAGGTAYGKSSADAGISLRWPGTSFDSPQSRRLGMRWYDVHIGSRHGILQDIDKGPHESTGRVIDVTGAGWAKMGGGPFPTDSIGTATMVGGPGAASIAGGGAQNLTQYKIVGATGVMRAVGQGMIDKSRTKAQAWLDAHQPQATGGGASALFGGATAPAGTTLFQGMPVANWIIPELRYAQAHGWHGHITSGYRSHAQNVAEGRFYHSQHEETKYPGGAVDFGGPGDSAGKLDFMAHVHGYTGPRLLEFAAGWDKGHMSGTGGQRGGFVGGRIRGFQTGGYTDDPYAVAASAPDQSHGGTPLTVAPPKGRTSHPRARRPARHRSSRARGHGRAHARPRPRPGSRQHPITIGVGRPTLATIKGGHAGDWIRMKDPSSRGRSELHTRGAWVKILTTFYARPTGAFAIPTTELPQDLYDDPDYQTSLAEYSTPFDDQHPGPVDPATGAYASQVDDLHALQGRERIDRTRISRESALYGRADHQEKTDTKLIAREDRNIKRLEASSHRGTAKQRAAVRKQLAAARARKAKLDADRRKAQQVKAGARKSLTSLYGDLSTTLGSEKGILDAPGAAAAAAGADPAAAQAEAIQILTDLLKTFVQNQEDIKQLAQTETTTIQAAIAAAASGQLGGNLGMSLQSPGFPGGGVRY